jgi:hypothetical protein
VKGYFCQDVNSTVIEGKCTAYGQTQYSSETCYDTRVVDLCPDGFYCPKTSTKRTCPVGSYCSIGDFEPQLCPFQGLLCPFQGMSAANSGALFLTFIIIFTVCVFTYKYAADKVVSFREEALDTATLLEAEKQATG